LRTFLQFGIFLLALPLVAQSNAGELRLKVADPQGLGVKTAVLLVSEANEYHSTLVTDDAGTLIAKRLRFGLYRVEIHHEGFADISAQVEIRSAIPVDYSVRLSLASVTASVTVQDSDTLIDPYRAGSANEIGAQSHSDPSHIAARALIAGSGQHAARMALRGQCRAAPARLRVSDSIRNRRNPAHRQSLPQLWSRD
jgi:hypothetical protein